ncbi:MAG: EAL domain-containing protein [Betaproteobacteria bacterium]|nr:EAL domain-containing protein [Betaproteobacteria bacterium]MDH3438316.1 EAL domain-containing protein [Betaproteobacteria bacterium]
MPSSPSDIDPGPGANGEPAPGAEKGVPTLARGQALYLTSLTQQLTGWDDPRAMLAQAIREGQFLLLAQKIVSLKPAAPDPIFYEILLRLKQEEDNLLPPGGFFDLAESVGMMEDVDRWVVRNVLAWSAGKMLVDPAAPPPMVCINVSGTALENPGFAREVGEQLRQSGFPPRALCFEISEIDVIKHQKATRRFVQSVKPGCRISIDSFTSIKVSFSHLTDLAVDFIKIDGDIVQKIAHNPTELAKVKAIVLACQRIGVRTIAEFVETKETLDLLREIGVDYVQGFGISRPEPISNLA